MLEKKDYAAKIEFDFEENGKFIACFVERYICVLEDGQEISRKIHRDVLSQEDGLQLLTSMGKK